MRNVSVLVFPVAMNLPGAANVLRMSCTKQYNQIQSSGRSCLAVLCSGSAPWQVDSKLLVCSV